MIVLQAQAMVEIVKQLGWTYVSTLAAQGEYGEKVSHTPLISPSLKSHGLHSSGHFIIYSVGKKVWSLYRCLRHY